MPLLFSASKKSDSQAPHQRPLYTREALNWQVLYSDRLFDSPEPPWFPTAVFALSANGYKMSLKLQNITIYCRSSAKQNANSVKFIQIQLLKTLS